jgi:hypothetical protein
MEFLGSRQSPLLDPFRSTQNQGPFPRPALPGFLGTMDPSDAHLGPPPARRLRVSDSLTPVVSVLMGLLPSSYRNSET